MSMNQNTKRPLRGTPRRMTWIVGLLMLGGLIAATSAGGRASAPDRSALSQGAANDLAAKITMLSDRHPRPSGALDPVTITDQEANSYLKYKGREFLPPALHDPEVHIMPSKFRAQRM